MIRKIFRNDPKYYLSTKYFEGISLRKLMNLFQNELYTVKKIHIIEKKSYIEVFYIRKNRIYS
jgi:hypothetical protein